MLFLPLSFFFFFSSRRRHTRSLCDWSSDVCSSDLQEVRLEQGLHHKLGRHLNHPVPHRRNAQRPLPPVRLRNVPAPHRLRPILPGLEIVLDTQQKRLDPLLLNGGDRLAIHPRSPTIAPYPPPRFPQD